MPQRDRPTRQPRRAGGWGVAARRNDRLALSPRHRPTVGGFASPGTTSRPPRRKFPRGGTFRPRLWIIRVCAARRPGGTLGRRLSDATAAREEEDEKVPG